MAAIQKKNKQNKMVSKPENMIPHRMLTTFFLPSMHFITMADLMRCGVT